jgi:hypothetical protein
MFVVQTLLLFSYEWTVHVLLLNMQLFPAALVPRVIDMPEVSHAVGAYLP